jgi:hypothetical protein
MLPITFAACTSSIERPTPADGGKNASVVACCLEETGPCCSGGRCTMGGQCLDTVAAGDAAVGALPAELRVPGPLLRGSPHLRDVRSGPGRLRARCALSGRLRPSPDSRLHLPVAEGMRASAVKELSPVARVRVAQLDCCTGASDEVAGHHVAAAPRSSSMSEARWVWASRAVLRLRRGTDGDCHRFRSGSRSLACVQHPGPARARRGTCWGPIERRSRK